MNFKTCVKLVVCIVIAQLIIALSAPIIGVLALALLGKIVG